MADALSRLPAVDTIQRGRRCPWYRRLSSQIRQHLQTVPDYALRGGRPFRHLLHDLDFRETPAEEQWKECVPSYRRPVVLRQYHDEPSASYLGTAKTIARMARLYYWPGMHRDIARYVQACPTCRAYKADQGRPAGTLRATHVQGPGSK